MSAHPYTVLDVFTATPLSGNALAVVHDADHLDEDHMLAVARETRLSETTFVQLTAQAGADYRLRIFTVGGELPFAGHPSLGTAVAVARRRGAESARLVQETGAGLQRLDVVLTGERARTSMLQEPASFDVEVDRERALTAAGLDAQDADPSLPPQVVSTGLANLIVPVAEASALARARFDPVLLSELLEPLGATVLYLAACDLERGRARARGFFHAGEDPATGSAAGPLGAYLQARRGLDALTVEQGVEMGRPSHIEVSCDGDPVRVGGDAVVVVEGTLRI